MNLCRSLKKEVLSVGKQGSKNKEKRWRTPAERAKIKLELGKKFQLLTMIKQAYAEE